MQETINQRIMRYRKKANYTQAQLGEKIGLKTSTYSQMERQGQITCEMLLRLADALKVDATVLLFGESEEFVEKDDAKSKRPEYITTFPMELTVREYNVISIFRNLSEQKKSWACENIFGLLRKKESKTVKTDLF